MTPKEFKRLRGDYTLSELSDMIGVTTRTIRRYEDGTREISKPVQVLMAYIAFGTIAEPCDDVIIEALGERNE